jgi:hypothetical protein
MLQFRGSAIISDAGLRAYRELDDTLCLTDTAAGALTNARTGKSGHYCLAERLDCDEDASSARAASMSHARRICRGERDETAARTSLAVLASISGHSSKRSAISFGTLARVARKSEPLFSDNQQHTHE